MGYEGRLGSVRAWVFVLSWVGLAATVGGLSGCGRSDLAERPAMEAGGGLGSIPTQPSTIGAQVKVPVADVVALANTAIPPGESVGWQNGEDLCARVLGQRVCVGTQFKYDWSRSPIEIRPIATGGIELNTNLSVSGQGGFRGDGARILRLDAKNFAAAADVTIGVVPTLGSDWCPKIKVTHNYRWTTRPEVEIVSRVSVTIASHVEPVVNEKLEELARLAENGIDCKQFKRQLEAVYGKRSFPVEVAPQQTMHVNVEPIDFAFSGLTSDAENFLMAALLTAKVEMSATPVQVQALPLPPLKSVSAEKPPNLALAVPVRAPISAIQEQAASFVVGKTFEGETPAGKANAKVTKLEVYPTTGGRLAVGVGLEAKLPGKLLDTKGEVYLVGLPVAEGATVVRLKDPSFTRILDNDVWNSLSVLFESTIREELEKGLRYDFGAEAEKAQQALAAKLADPSTLPQAKVSVSDVRIGIGRVGIEGQDLVAEAKLEASVSAALNVNSIVKSK